MKRKLFFLMASLGISSLTVAQGDIKLRDLSYFYKEKKEIRIRDHEPSGKFEMVNADSKKVVFTGELKEMPKDPPTKMKMVTKAEITAYDTPGKYFIRVPEFGATPVFEITMLNHKIRLNQIGYYPDAPKYAVVIDATAPNFFLVDAKSNDTVFGGPINYVGEWKHSKEQVSQINFSRFKKPGTYKLAIPDMGLSHTFTIGDNVHKEIATATLKGYYYQRASIELEEKYAGKFKRGAGHPDNEVYVHASAADKKRPAGTKISCPKGWYDAGDYGKYIVNSGITTYTLLAFFEHDEAYAKSIDANIPESGDEVPDLLDEIKWNLDWMLTMQDPNDGGVYHKLSTANFIGADIPSKAGGGPRYVVQKGTGATLDFAAVMAVAARVYKKYDKQFPGYAAQCLAAAKKAYAWAEVNPQVEFKQEELNTNLKPDQPFNDPIKTGGYGDSNFKDEKFWASAELFLTTGDDKYTTGLAISSDYGTPSWASVGTLGHLSLANHDNKYQKAAQQQIIKLANPLKDYAKYSEYEVAMGAQDWNFVWGSNSVAANQGILLLNAYKFTKDKNYLEGALKNLDYLMGRNATSYCFLTGFGGHSPMDIHHRPSKGDDIEEPVPGLIAGGPQNGKQDRCTYPGDEPANCYVDSWCSYSTNEIAINWNAPLFYLAAGVDSEYQKK